MTSSTNLIDYLSQPFITGYYFGILTASFFVLCFIIYLYIRRERRKK